MSNKTAIDVGANTGNDTERLANEYDIVIAFEPNPDLLGYLHTKFRDNNKVVILPFAIDIENGPAVFNIADIGDKGYSSLYDYHHKLMETPLKQYDVYRAGFQWKKLVVKTRLDSIIDILKIEHIDYLHIDAQGNDLNVLKSLGDKISTLKAGQGEFTHKIPIYNGTSNTAEEAMNFLSKNGFKSNIVYTHENDSEVDIAFWRE